MKFPGQRKSKHYFPVDRRDPLISQSAVLAERGKAYVVGIDQTLVDIEAHVDLAFLERYGLSRGHSMLISDDVAEQIYDELKSNNMVVSEFAGGTIGNTMHNYSVLADSHSILLGVMSQDIRIGSYAYRYLCNTSSRVNLDYLQPVDGPVGRCFTFITEGANGALASTPARWIIWMWPTSPRPSSRSPLPWSSPPTWCAVKMAPR
ncbi:inosine/guanosine kinase [Aeromonas hydrophila]|nr:inosine/guanosine kinase [Aeromonas hydrophila]